MFTIHIFILSLLQGLATSGELLDIDLGIYIDLESFISSLQELSRKRLEVNLVTLSCRLYDLEPFLSLADIGIPINTGYEDSQVKFHLWTRENKEEFNELQYNDIISLQNSKFDGLKKTYFILHGWTQNGHSYWVSEMVTNLLKIEDANVIAVTEPLFTDYSHAVCNVYKIAKHMANFIKWLTDKTQLLPSKIHVIGHSLGAQIAGLTGYNWNRISSLGKISRITGLDPAGPLFANSDPARRIHKEHADYVDVIHTSHLGLPDAVGHADFFVNGGFHQPGCLFSPNETQEYYANAFEIVCSHMRACSYYLESIVLEEPQDLTFKSWPCSSYEDYKDGKCKECTPQCLQMGLFLNTDITDQKFYLTTESTDPFAKGDVQ